MLEKYYKRLNQSEATIRRGMEKAITEINRMQGYLTALYDSETITKEECSELSAQMFSYLDNAGLKRKQYEEKERR